MPSKFVLLTIEFCKQIFGQKPLTRFTVADYVTAPGSIILAFKKPTYLVQSKLYIETRTHIHLYVCMYLLSGTPDQNEQLSL